MMAIQIRASACSDKGCVRQNNEDSFCLNGFHLERQDMDKGGLFKCHVLPNTLFAVCDGMGGEEAGEEASLLSVKMCGEFLKTPEKWNDEGIKTFLRSGCQNVYDQARRRGNRSGATIAMTLMGKNGVRIANMGDSRIYRLHQGKMTQISYDHTEMHKLLLQGKIRPEDVATHPKRHMINQYWGMPLERAPFTPYILEPIPYVIGDRYLLCSDGLTDMLADAQIEELLRAPEPVERISERLVAQAKKNGGRDNVTVIVVEIAQAEENASAPETERRVPAEQSEIRNLKGKRMRTKLMMGLMLAAQLYTLLEIVDLLLFVM